MTFPLPVPVPSEGETLLNDVETSLRNFVAATDEELTAITLWAAHTHSYQAFRSTPRLAITSPVPGCGKTTLLECIHHLVPKPLDTSNITPAALYHVIDGEAPTLLIDEFDSFASAKELRNILNSGYTRGTPVFRMDRGFPRSFDTWCPAAIALIGELPDTLTSRSIPVRLQKSLPNQPLKDLYGREAMLANLGSRLRLWSVPCLQALCSAAPVMPPQIKGRDAVNWRPLFALADIAGGAWPFRARQAAIKLLADASGDRENEPTTLLADIRWIFDGKPDLQNGATVTEYAPLDRIPTHQLLYSLKTIDGRPWGTYLNGRPITASALATLLKPLRISPGSIRLVGGSTPKGYTREKFEDAFARYLSPVVQIDDDDAKQTAA